MANRLSTANWPFAVKFLIPCLIALALVVSVEAIAVRTINHLSDSLQDVVERKYNASVLLSDSIDKLRAANGKLAEMQIKQAAGIPQKVSVETDAITANLDKIADALTDFKTRYAKADDAVRIDKAIASVKTYKDAVGFVGSMLETDFKSTVSFVMPLNASYDQMIADLTSISGEFLATSRQDSQAAVEKQKADKRLLYTISFFALLFATVVVSIIIRSTTSSIDRLTVTTQRLADGDVNVDIASLERGDELGNLVKALSIFRDNIERVNTLKAEQVEMERKAAQQKKEALESLAKNFEDSVGRIVSLVAASATELQSNAENLASAADQTSRLSATVSTATDEASASVQTVASAAEELSASIGEINHQVDESMKVAASAVDEVKHTDTTVSSLSEAATQIGDVVKLIQNIAGQTNLLALNATIEAARAGEAGKGFAVVASEVKNLATQTAKATEEISAKIQTVQTASAEAVNAIRGIGKTIERISGVTEVISNAVQQQNSATREISGNVQKASTSTSTVSNDIAGVTSAASDSRQAASGLLQTSGQLSEQSKQLRAEIQTFLQILRRG